MGICGVSAVVNVLSAVDLHEIHQGRHMSSACDIFIHVCTTGGNLFCILQLFVLFNLVTDVLTRHRVRSPCHHASIECEQSLVSASRSFVCCRKLMMSRQWHVIWLSDLALSTNQSALKFYT